jgi:hypothetical protein
MKKDKWKPICNSLMAGFKNYLGLHALMRLHGIFIPSVCCVFLTVGSVMEINGGREMT